MFLLYSTISKKYVTRGKGFLTFVNYNKHELVVTIVTQLFNHNVSQLVYDLIHRTTYLKLLIILTKEHSTTAIKSFLL